MYLQGTKIFGVKVEGMSESEQLRVDVFER